MNIILTLLIVALTATPAYSKEFRSTSARADFMRDHPCPSTGKAEGSCPGYIVDHIKAVHCGGSDSPGNMQWQTVQQAREKDRWELNCQLPASPQSVSSQCGGKTRCSEMADCAEAKHYLIDCKQDQLDRDHDGLPCESLCQ